MSELRPLDEINGKESMQITGMIISFGLKITKDKILRKYVTGNPPDGTTKRDWNIEYAAELYNAMCTRYKDDSAEILAAVSGVSEEEYLKDDNPGKIMDDIGTLMGDKTFNRLFFACVPRKASTSGSTSENTKAPKA